VCQILIFRLCNALWTREARACCDTTVASLITVRHSIQPRTIATPSRRPRTTPCLRAPTDTRDSLGVHMTSSTNTHAGRNTQRLSPAIAIDLRVCPFLPSRFAALAELAALEAAEHAGGDAVAASPNVAAEATEARACTQRCNVQCAWRTARAIPYSVQSLRSLRRRRPKVASMCDACDAITEQSAKLSISSSQQSLNVSARRPRATGEACRSWDA
jgi:hypothetical protein